MPLYPINYSNTIIYKIICKDLNIIDTYIGYTTNFKNRKQSHKCTWNNINCPNYNCKVYKFIRLNGGWGNWSMIELEKFPCRNKEESMYRETFWIQTLRPSLNTYYQQKIILSSEQKIIKDNNRLNNNNNINNIYMTDIKEFIKNKRPNLSEGSLTTYASILRSLYKKIYGTGTVDFDKFNDTEKVLEYLKDLEPNKRKTILSGLVVVTDKKEYRDKMLDDVSSYNKDIKKQEKSDTQKENWVTIEDIKNVYDTLKKNADMLYKKKTFTANELQQIQNFIILSLLGGVFIPPRRSLDYVSFKHKNIDKTKNNYLEKNKMVFNTYKTAKTYGQQVVDIPIQLKNILTKWFKINPTDYLLFDTNGNKLNSVKLNQRFNAIFNGRKISTNGMRHAFLTDKYAETSKKQKELESDMKEMGSSSDMAKTYIKLD